MNKHLPEGRLISSRQNTEIIKTIEGLEAAARSEQILEARAVMCDKEHNLTIKLPCCRGIIPRSEGAVGIDDGTTRDIALLSRVNKPVCFKVLSIDNSGSEPLALLSRKAAQEEAYTEYISSLKPGDVISARVTHLEQFGCFVDVCCGIPSMIPIDAISVSRISHPSDRFKNGQDLLAVVKLIENGRIYLSHKELLGTWEENAAYYEAGETVSGIIRSIEDYGIFVELTPNLAGLAELHGGVKVGQSASVFIKSIIPDRMKIKLIIVDVLESLSEPVPFEYYITSGRINRWRYSTENSPKQIVSEF